MTKGKQKAHPWDALQQKQRKIAMAMGREGDLVEVKVCAPPRYVAIERRVRASILRRKKTSTATKNKGVSLRGESTCTLRMHYNKKEKEQWLGGK